MIEISKDLIGKKVFYVRDYNAYEKYVKDIKDEFIKFSWFKIGNGDWERIEDIEIREILR